MKTWQIVAAKKCIEIHYENGKKEAWRSGTWKLVADYQPEFDLRPVPGGDGSHDAIDILDCGYDLELVEINDKWWGDDIDPNTDIEQSIWIWDFQVIPT